MPPGLSAADTIADIREQGGLVGVPHPVDRSRGYGRTSGAQLEDIADKVDWIEVYNARVIGGSANEQAAIFAREHKALRTRIPFWKWASRTTYSWATQARPQHFSRRSPALTSGPAMPVHT